MSCNECNQPKPTCCDSCNSCNKCGCGRPILDIDEMPDSVSTLRFNVDGLSSWYDYGNMIYQTQTDTSISADALNRVLKYMAERHEDSISARELGSILHIADIGDVDASGAGNNALFVYKKNSDCAHGCEGIENSWTAWNASEHRSASVRTLMGFDDSEAPVSLAAPASADQFHLLGWKGEGQVGYMQPQEAVSLDAIKDSDGYVYKLYLDPKTKEIVYVKEKI